MTSASDEESAATTLKLNPQALDFVPTSSPVQEVASDRTPTSDINSSDFNDLPDTQSDITPTAKGRWRKPRTRRKKRHFETLDLSKDISDKTSEDKPRPDKSFFSKQTNKTTATKSGAQTRTVAKPSVPGYIGASQKDKEDNATIYGHALTWKSENIKAKDEYARLRRNVRAVAPEQFLDKAKPSGQRANIFPRSVSEYQLFKSESVKDRLKELSEDTKKMGDRVEAMQNMDKDGVPRSKRVPKSVFGGEGKVFKDGLGPVFGLPTIWSEEYMKSDQPKADWPTRAELLEDGDQRENSQVQTRAGRHLPTPRFPQNPGDPYVSFKDRPAIPLNPLDQTGPLYRDGLGEITEPSPVEIDGANEEMNNDPTFEAQALHFLGSDLMDDIGRWKPAVVPEWQSLQRQEQKAQADMAEGLSKMHLKNVHSNGQHQTQGQSSNAALWTPNGLDQDHDQSYSNGFSSAGDAGSFHAQVFDQAGMSASEFMGHDQDQSPGDSTDYAGLTSAADMAGWKFMGRSELYGSDLGEDLWMSPWGQVFRNRDGYWY